MLTYSGKTINNGIAMGRALIWKKSELLLSSEKVEDTVGELARFEEALESVKGNYNELKNKAYSDTGRDAAAIIQAHEMLLVDEEFLGAIERNITDKKDSAEYAVYEAKEEFMEIFLQLDDEFMKTRAVDIQDVSERIIRALLKDTSLDQAGNDMSRLSEPALLFAEELTPSETLQFDRKKLLGLVTRKGSDNSHTAILARMLGIPAIVCPDMNLETMEKELKDCAFFKVQAILNGTQGKLILGPTDQDIEQAYKELKAQKERESGLLKYVGLETITQNGQSIELCANISSPDDLEWVQLNDANGVGLFRSEFLYLDRQNYPSEEEQYQAYRQVAETLEDKRCVIRTFDIGADKQVSYLGLNQEENPAMGYRAIRICLKEKDLFKTQLRALFRAAAYGNLSVMYPMISSVDEVEQIQSLVKEVEEELKAEKLHYRIPEQGIMIETPAAVMLSLSLAEMVDFFSIGTNDLMQFVYGCDRMNEKLRDFCDAGHTNNYEALIQMIGMTVKSAHAKKKWVGICGEMAADPAFLQTWVDMGVDELSMAPNKILEVRKLIREL